MTKFENDTLITLLAMKVKDLKENPPKNLDAYAIKETAKEAEDLHHTLSVVICYMIDAGEGSYHIDSVWTSSRKAERRSKELNSDDKEEWRENYGFGLFQAEPYPISK